MFRSLRWRILCWHGLTLLLVVGGFGGFLYARIRQDRFKEVDAELKGAAQVVVSLLRTLPPHEFEWDQPLGSPPMRRDRFDGPPHRPGAPRFGPDEGLERRPPPREQEQFDRLLRNLDLPSSFVERRSDGDSEAPFFIVWRPAGDVLRQSIRAPQVQPLDGVLLAGYPEGYVAQAGNRRSLWLAGPHGSSVVVGCSVRRELADLRQWQWNIAAVGGGLLLLGLAGGWWMSHGVLRSIRRMSNEAARISERNLSQVQVMDVSAVDAELALLAGTLNRTFARLAAAFERQRQFTGDASHELRTPLTVILGNLELALSSPKLPPELRESLRGAQRAAKRMKSLTEHLLALARSDGGALAVERDNFDLCDVVHDCVELLRPLALENRVTVDVLDEPAEISADQKLLSQVVINLVSNAIQYNRPGGKVTVSLASAPGEVLLRVRDTGQGIHPAALEHVFERFFRADESRARQRQGSGLGLAITKSIVDAHGGRIEVLSEVDAGTEFRVHLSRYQLVPLIVT